MKQQNLALVYDIDYERKQRILAFLLNPSNVRAFDSLGWKYPKTVRIAKRAVALGMKGEKR